MARPKVTHEALEGARETGDLEALANIWRGVASASNDDEDAQRTRRQIEAKIKKLTAGDNCRLAHPDEKMVEMYVPMPVGCGNNMPFTIKNARGAKGYRGHVIVPECVARTLAHMISENRRVDAERMRNNGQIVDLDNPVAARARIIQAAE